LFGTHPGYHTANMSCNEKTALLATQQGHQQRQQQHIIVVPATGKDPKDYEPIFTTAE